MSDFYRDKYLVDIILHSDESVDCHKCVLSAGSEHFRLQLKEDSTSVNMINIPTLANISKVILEYIYTGECVITSDNVDLVMKASITLKLDHLKYLCMSFIKRSLEVMNCTHYYELATNINDEDLLESTRTFIRYHYTEMVYDKHFTTLNKEAFQTVLEMCDDEDMKLDVVLMWVEEHPECDSRDRSQLLRKVCFTDLSLDRLKMAQQHDMMKDQAEQRLIGGIVIKLLEDSINKPVEYLAYLSRDKYMCKYEEQSKSWSKVLKIPDWFDGCTSFCTHKSFVFMVGSRDAGHVAMLDMKTAQTTSLPDLPSPVSAPGVHVTDDCLFVIGGRVTTESGARIISKQVLRINITSPQSWDVLPELNTAVECPVVTSSAESILVMGGYDGSQDTSTLQIYNKASLQCTPGANIPVPCNAGRARCVTKHNTISLFTGTTRIKYDHVRDQWVDLLNYKNITVRVFSVVSYRGHILGCGVVDGCMSVFRYQPSHPNRWVKEDINVSECLSPYRFLQITM